MVRKATGASYPAVSDRIIFESEIPLPPVAEQKRIAAILDQADELKRKRAASLETLSVIPISIFHDRFGDPIANEMGWRTVRLKSVTLKIGSGATPTGGESSYKSNGISLIRSMNVHDGNFIREGLAFLDTTQAKKLDNVIVFDIDVLLNITGASVARVCRCPKYVLPARVNQHVSIIRPNKMMDTTFLEGLLMYPSMKRYLLQIGEAGATRQAITKAQLEELEIPLPPLSAQREFADAIGRVVATRDKQSEHLAKLDVFFSSLQDRAVRGELASEAAGRELAEAS